MAERFKIIQKALVERDGKLLLIRRSENDAIFPGKWDLPGGTVEFGEGLTDSIRREVLEETGLLPDEVKQLGTCSYVYDGRSQQFIVIAYLIESYHGRLALSHEHSQHAWLTMEQTLNYDITETLRHIFSMLASNNPIETTLSSSR